MHIYLGCDRQTENNKRQINKNTKAAIDPRAGCL